MPDRKSIYEGLQPRLEDELHQMDNKALNKTISSLERLLKMAKGERKHREDIGGSLKS